MKYFKLSGGLGNQLFIYAAALAHTSEFEIIVLEGHETPKYSNSSSTLLTELALAPGAIVTHSKLSFQVTRLLDYLHKRAPNNLGNGESELGYVGTSRRFFHNRYFQTYKYYESSQRAQLWIQQAFGLTGSSTQVIDEVAVHVRLGDYEGLSETFGLLSTDYYSAALDSIGVSSGSRVVVFSNDPIGAKSLLEEPLKGLEVTFKEPADSPVDDLSLMATYRDLIIANSSFSYWAGMLGRNNVYAPDKWFRSLDDPSELHPPYWKLIESAWR